jgi:hypothetical protein
MDLTARPVASADEYHASQLARQVQRGLTLQDGFEDNPQLQPVFDCEQPCHQHAVPRAAMA